MFNSFIVWYSSLASMNWVPYPSVEIQMQEITNSSENDLMLILVKLELFCRCLSRLILHDPSCAIQNPSVEEWLHHMLDSFQTQAKNRTAKECP
mmetsp:Transcript_16211/g.27684  ORF Transcript_16211/g.27684 Transcript_16211/m.27684 type:complete len:94 (+) Transcript_16211:211-492(+)